MKTPDEIKKLLANHKNYIYSAEELFADALSYIRELEAKVAELDKRCEAYALNATTAIRELEETKLRCLEQIKVYADKLAEYEKPLRSMTLDEVKRHVKEPEAEPVWLEDVEEPSNTGWTYSHIIYDWMHGFDERTYGKEWRCWPRRPTEEERKAVEWDD